MAWYYRNPEHFPAIFTRGLVQAAASPSHPHILYHAVSKSDAQAKAGLFRWFKWCCEQPPLVIPSALELLRDFDFRTAVKPAPEYLSGNPFILWLTAQPKFIDSLTALNPHLVELVEIECQWD